MEQMLPFVMEQILPFVLQKDTNVLVQKMIGHESKKNKKKITKKSKLFYFLC